MKPKSEMIGAQRPRANVRPGGFLTRRKPHREVSMVRIRLAAEQWLNAPRVEVAP